MILTLRQWWNSDFQPPGLPPASSEAEDRFDFPRLVPYLFLHAGCLLLIWVGWSWFAVAAALLLYGLRMFAVTAFYHRYFSHRAFRTSRFAQCCFAVAGNTSMQRGPLWWAATHRHHHQHSDSDEDKHSPRERGFWWSHLGWLTSRRNFPTDYAKVKDFASYPELVFLNRHDFLVPLVYGAALWGIGEALAHWAPGLGTNGPQLFVWGFFVSTVVLLHGTLCINSLAHLIGSRRFETNDDSRNSLPLALITLGEGWHNNHHRYASSARQGFYWYEIDISWYVLRLLARVGLIWDLKEVPVAVYLEGSAGKPGSRTKP
ncbi:MAG: acyl-CoA desaturase [Verrucomicrobiae bacterium]|nr:acyl-CoA desaturase [Verrucomicrobiae bacterium]